MRLLVTIPHVFNPDGGGGYASLSPDPQPRILALTLSLQSLQAVFGSSQLYFRYSDRIYEFAANQKEPIQLDIVICTSRGLHILDRLPISPQYYQHYPTQCEPMLLGFECHGILKSCLGQYDYYCYMEDDLILSDPLFLQKIAWFNSFVGDAWLLQPNRFELQTGLGKDKPRISKNYIDPEIRFHTGEGDNFAHYFKDNLTVKGVVMGREIILKRAENPHSGCFFLNERQMAYWAGKDYFLDRDSRFFGPLESAASLGIARTFRIYKPAPENANFLEIQHFGESWSNKIYNTIFR